MLELEIKLKSIQDKVNNATPGPWIGWNKKEHAVTDGEPAFFWTDSGPKEIYKDRSIGLRIEDGIFISSAREDIPNLLKVISVMKDALRNIEQYGSQESINMARSAIKSANIILS